MKIIGFVYHDEGHEMVLKGDSCLLNGRKPMFIPDWTDELGVTECLILRVSRLGKEIASRFADRYYDAVAYGADFVAMDKQREAQASGCPWTRSIAFDYSLAIGEWLPAGEETVKYGDMPDEWVMTPEEAVEEASRWMTIRQGDLIYIQKKQAPRAVHKEEIIHAVQDGKEVLYCKVK